MKRAFLFLWYAIGAVLVAPGLAYFAISYYLGIFRNE